MADTENEPHLTIDSYNSLYILHATKNEEGIYTCFVDDKKVQKYSLRIVSKSKLLNDGQFFLFNKLYNIYRYNILVIIVFYYTITYQ